MGTVCKFLKKSGMVVRAESQLARHDRGKQVFHWREQGLPGQETGEDTPHLRPPAAGPPGLGSAVFPTQHFTAARPPAAGYMVSAVFQVPETRGGGFLHTTGGSFHVCV